MKKLLERLLKMKGVKKAKKLSNNKGFSLIELLIVIAIMGVLAVIAFNMFGGVLSNSKMRADDQQARNIEKAILTYCVDSGDWKLNKGKVGTATTTTDFDGQSDDALIAALMQQITVDGKIYGPMLSLKDPSQGYSDDVNKNAYEPQWNDTNGTGEYNGWSIVVYTKKQAVKVTPEKDSTKCVVDIDTNP